MCSSIETGVLSAPVSQAWIPMSYGKVPLHAVVGGQENGRQVYVARVSVGDNNMVPGKLIEGSQTAETVLFGVRTSAAYEIFAHSDPKRKIKWVNTAGVRVPKGAVLVGQSGKYQRYTGRLHHSSGSILLGKYVMPDGVFYYQYQGKEVDVTKDFEVLCVVWSDPFFKPFRQQCSQLYIGSLPLLDSHTVVSHLTIKILLKMISFSSVISTRRREACVCI